MDALLCELPDGFHTIDYGDAVVILGPTGAFALASGEPDVEAGAHRAAEAALRVRDLLCRVLSWAPFVDALVVSDGPTGHLDEATLVPRRRLRDVLTNGGVQLRDTDIGRILGALGN